MPVYNPNSLPIVLGCSGELVEHTGDTDDFYFGEFQFGAGQIGDGDVLVVEFTMGVTNVTSGSPFCILEINGGSTWAQAGFSADTGNFIYTGRYILYITTISGGGPGVDPGVSYDSGLDTSAVRGGLGLADGYDGRHSQTNDLREGVSVRFRGRLGNAADTMYLLGYTAILYKKTPA